MSSYDEELWLTDLKRSNNGHVVDCRYRDCSRDDGDGYGGFCDDCEHFYCNRHEDELERGLCPECRKLRRENPKDHFEHLERFTASQITSTMLREAFQNCFNANGMEECLREHEHFIHQDGASNMKCFKAYEALKNAFNYFD